MKRWNWLRAIKPRWWLLLICLSMVGVIRYNPAWGEGYSCIVYPRVSVLLAAISDLFPFSLGDCFIYGSLLGLAVYLVYAFVRRRGWKVAMCHVGEYLAWVYLWFYAAWGLNYYRADFYQRAGLSPEAFSEARFQSFLTSYIDSLNGSWCSVGQEIQESVPAEVLAGYRLLPDRLGLAIPSADARVKTMLFSRLMSRVGVTGYMGPFFSEFHLNRQLPPVQYPATYAHELAHRLGVSSEAEANLYAYWVCVHSQVPAIRFSGYFSLLPYVLSNAYGVLGQEQFDAWRERIRPEILELYRSKVAYWRSLYSPWLGEAQALLYDLFLKGNKISSGTANYAEVIALLIAWEDGATILLPNSKGIAKFAAIF